MKGVGTLGEELTGKIKKYLSNNLWYHATTLDGWYSICKLGIKVDYNRETSLGTDFGFGYYLTNQQSKAEDFIKRLITAKVIENSVPVVIEFEFCPLPWFECDDYKTYILNAHDDEFAAFIFDNRTNNINGKKQHSYDAMFGVMSDSKPTMLLLEYNLGRITKEDVLKELKKTNSMKQLSLHNQALCDIIKPQRVYTFDVDTESRRELNANDYYNR